MATGIVSIALRLAGFGWAWRTPAATAAAFLGVAAVLWAVLLPRVVRAVRRPLPGAAYLVTVATQSVAVLGAMLAAGPGPGRLVWTAGVLLGGGLVLYFVVLARFDLGQVAAGAGGHWVAGGSLAISTVAAARVAAAAGPPARAPLEWLTLAVLAAVLGW
ncbi:hypothetical protein [Actinomadura decatromicini]|uniref:hypothetical protein n=1 Tax=Actinomadura decatromicini TaxID=2604572 RepID=UPI001FE5059C|nr:hypothetical protein [Actinomadura decatromicini]